MKTDYMSVQEAADLMNASLAYVFKLIMDGDLTCVPVGNPFLSSESTNALSREHVLEYMAAQNLRRQAAMQEMVSLSQELGLYD